MSDEIIEKKKKINMWIVLMIAAIVIASIGFVYSAYNSGMKAGSITNLNCQANYTQGKTDAAAGIIMLLINDAKTCTPTNITTGNNTLFSVIYTGCLKK